MDQKIISINFMIILTNTRFLNPALMFEPIIFLVGGRPVYWKVFSIIPGLCHSDC